MSSNPLTPIWDAYNASKDAFRIAKKAINHPEKLILLKKTRFRLQSITDAETSITQSAEITEDLFVLSLWSTYERFVRIYLQQKGTTLQTIQPAILAPSMYTYFCDEVEFWKPNQILDLLKKTLFTTHSHMIGQAKQILAYRDWIAHGKNPDKQPSSNITAPFAYKILNEIVETLLLN